MTPSPSGFFCGDTNTADSRYSTGPNDVKRYTTEELRKEFLIMDLYQPDTVRAVYSHVDRMVVPGIFPVKETVPIDKGIAIWGISAPHISWSAAWRSNLISTFPKATSSFP